MAKLIQFVKFKNKKKKFTTFRLPKELNDKEDANYCFLYLMSNLVGRWLSGKESACNAGDTGSVPGLGRSPGNPFQYSCLENPMDRGAWWAAVHRVAQVTEHVCIQMNTF